MRIAVFGAGAIGSYLGGMLSVAHDVILIGREEHVRAVRREGLRVGDHTFRPGAVTSAGEAGEQDVVLITVKAYDTAEAVASIPPLIGEGTVVASIQNGLGNHRLLPPGTVLGVTSMGVTFVAPGEVRFAGPGPTLVGPEGKGASLISSLLSRAGLPCRVSGDILADIWRKAIVNAAVNPITAIVRRENGALSRGELRSLSAEVCREAAEVARAEGHDLGDPFSTVEEVVRRTAGNRSSMLQDVEAGRRTEIEEITGEIVRIGEGRGAPTPYNRALLLLVRGMEPVFYE